MKQGNTADEFTKLSMVIHAAQVLTVQGAARGWA